MKQSLRKVIAISCAALLLVMAGCTGKDPASTGSSTPTTDVPKNGQTTSGEQVVLQVSQWHTLEEQFNKPFMEIVANFEAENPDIKIEPVEIAWGDTIDQLTIRASGNNCPDVMLLTSDWVSVLGSMGVLADLDMLLQPATIQALEWARPTTLDPVTIDGKLEGLVWYTYSFPLMYNKTALTAAGQNPDQMPDTWGDFEAQLKDIVAANAGIYAFTRDFTQGAGGGRTFIPWLWAYGGDLFDKDGAINYDSPEGVAALTAMVEVAAAGKTGESAFPIGVGQYPAREVFAQNKIAYMQESSWMRPILRDLSGKGESYDAQWGFAPWPKSDVTGRRDTLIDAHVWGIWSGSPHQAEAARFVEYLVMNRQAQETFLSAFGSLSPVEDFQDLDMYKDPYYTACLEAMSDGRSLPANPQISAILTDVSVAMLEALNGGDPATVLQNAANISRTTLGQPTR